MNSSATFQSIFSNRKMVVLSNREPYTHQRGPKGIRCCQSVGGLVSAFDPLLQKIGGTWIAWGDGEADWSEVPSGRLDVPPGQPGYTLHRLRLSDEEVKGYYEEYANRGLWPLSHLLVERADFSTTAWQTYARVNRRFAMAAAAAAATGDLVFVNDYHLSLVPAILGSARPDLRIATFWHIPWPPYSVFRLCPQREEILRGLLGSHLLGFHTPEYTANFLEAVGEELGATVDSESGVVCYAGKKTTVGAFPLGIDYQTWRNLAMGPEATAFSRRLDRHYRQRGRIIGVAVDRLDYTKGILQRLKGLNRFFDLYPAYRGRVTLFQVVVPNRTSIHDYAELETEIAATTARMKAAHRIPGWVPIIPVTRKLVPEHLSAIYRGADFAIVSPLFDGMNLVAKEFVTCQVEQRGVLLLSSSAGASQELAEALPINPLDPDGFASALAADLEMPANQRRQRLETMQSHLEGSDIYHWMEEFFGTLDALPVGDIKALSGPHSTVRPGEQWSKNIVASGL